MSDGERNEPMLAGMRLVEVSAFVAAPLGGMTLAQLGADVIRIDHLAGGLDWRRWPVTADNVSLFWCGLNKGKRSVAIDLNADEGRELASALIAAPGDGGGLFLTNMPPRGWLDYERLRARRPDLIQVTVQGDRHGGSAVDYTVNSRIGLPYITGSSSLAVDDAVNHVLPAWDVTTGHMASIALLAAERHRTRHGVGQHIKLALEDMALAVMGHLGFIAEAQRGEVRPRIGNYLFGAFARDFATADGERVMVVGLTLKQWRGLCAATASGAAMDAIAQRHGLDFDAEGDRYRVREEIAAVVGAWIAARPLAEVSAALEANGVCWGPYRTLAQLVASDPSCSEANPLFRTVEQPGVGRYLMPATPLRSDAVAALPPRAAPRLGEHTAEVLGELLGLSDAAVGRLLDRGLVRSAA
jgi:2-methylfumaryl-CoA isomerase